MFFPGRLGKFCFSSRAVLFPAPLRHLSGTFHLTLPMACTRLLRLGDCLVKESFGGELNCLTLHELTCGNVLSFRSQDEPGSLQDPGGARDIIVFYFRMLSSVFPWFPIAHQCRN